MSARVEIPVKGYLKIVEEACSIRQLRGRIYPVALGLCPRLSQAGHRASALQRNARFLLTYTIAALQTTASSPSLSASTLIQYIKFIPKQNKRESQGLTVKEFRWP